ncbi:MAG: hypothetical protein JSC161_000516 [Candidatus Tokpelaia sp. JSC161]|jgi:predicted N-acetyltransferase YhbS|nr:MAG: hypothetical protein JSC161_000516 [Candidatus Tokpelaia sp. JSC161]
MKLVDITYMHESSIHHHDIENLHATAFGPARYTRAAHFIRHGGSHDRSISFIASAYQKIIASIRMTPIIIGFSKALLLGPIVVSSTYKNAGIGSTLINMALKAAEKKRHKLVILIGDEAYYRRFHFLHVHADQMIMPLPVNPKRLLGREFTPGALSKANGIVRHINCLRNETSTIPVLNCILSV